MRDPLRRKMSHICTDLEEDISTPTSAPIETELLVWPPQQWESTGRRTKSPDRQRREQLTEKNREAGRSLMNREKSTGTRTNPCGTLRRNRKERVL